MNLFLSLLVAGVTAAAATSTTLFKSVDARVSVDLMGVHAFAALSPSPIVASGERKRQLPACTWAWACTCPAGPLAANVRTAAENVYKLTQFGNSPPGSFAGSSVEAVRAGNSIDASVGVFVSASAGSCAPQASPVAVLTPLCQCFDVSAAYNASTLTSEAFDAVTAAVCTTGPLPSCAYNENAHACINRQVNIVAFCQTHQAYYTTTPPTVPLTPTALYFGASANATTTDLFGNGVALSTNAGGEWLFVGAHNKADAASNTNGVGAAFVFKRNAAGAWDQQPTLLRGALTADGNFGADIAAEGDYVVAGHRYARPVGGVKTGAAVIFKRSGSSWIEATTLVSNTPLQDESFGWSVAISGTNQVLVGSNSLAAAVPGSVHLFTRTTGTEAWTQTARWANTGAPNRYGISVSLLSTRAFIGWPGRSGGGAAQVVHRNSDGSWPAAISQELVSPLPVANGEFGFSVAASGDYLVVGERLGGVGGRAWVFKYAEATGFNNPVQITPPSVATNDNYGFSVAIDGTRIAVSARYDDGASNDKTDAGAIYFWTLNTTTGTWQQTAVVRGDTANGVLGNEHVDILGNRAVSGAPFDSPAFGKVVVVDSLA